MTVRTDRMDDVELVTLDRPKALNSFDTEAAQALDDALKAAFAHDDVRAIVITGAGDRAFCTGADIHQFHEAIERGNAPEVVGRTAGTFNQVIERIVTGDKPVVAAINGVTAGGGLGLALACDVRIASQTARFLTAFMNVAVSPDGGTTWLLPRTIGWARAREMLLLNPVVDPKLAVEWGLVTECVPSAEVLERSLEVANRLASNPRQAMAWAKQRLAEDRPLAEHLAWEREATMASASTDDFGEGLTAFFEKRPPKFA